MPLLVALDSAAPANVAGLKRGFHMKTNLAASLLAVLGGAAAVLMPGTSTAGNIGYYEMCSGQG